LKTHKIRFHLGLNQIQVPIPKNSKNNQPFYHAFILVKILTVILAFVKDFLSESSEFDYPTKIICT